MDKLIIDGKEFDINVSYGNFEKAYQRQEKLQKKGANGPQILIDVIWIYLERGFIFKPFILKRRLKNKISFKELQDADKKIAELITIEGREGN